MALAPVLESSAASAPRIFSGRVCGRRGKPSLVRACGIVSQRPAIFVRQNFHRDLFAGKPPPAIECVAVHPRLHHAGFRASGDAIEEINVALDVFAGGRMFSRLPVHLAHGTVRLLERPRVAIRFGKRRSHRQSAGRGHRDRRIPIHGLFVLAPGKESQPR